MTRSIGGKEFYLYSTHQTKDKAKTEAEKQRKFGSGYNARVIKTPYGGKRRYEVWVSK